MRGEGDFDGDVVSDGANPMTLAARERDAAIRQAVEAEREACAKLAERFSDEAGYDGLTARLIAEGIRGRGGRHGQTTELRRTTTPGE